MSRTKTPAVTPPSLIKPITVSIAVAAEALDVDPQTIARLIKAKKLRASKVARRVLIRVVDIETMLTASEV